MLATIRMALIKGSFRLSAAPLDSNTTEERKVHPNWDLSRPNASFTQQKPTNERVPLNQR